MEKLRLFNSLTKKKELFMAPSHKVGIYACGITPDAPAHLGHAFVFTSFDVLMRYLRHLGYQTTYVQNVTDIDDDILQRSKKQGENWKKFGNTYIKEFLSCMSWLNNVQPNAYPRATDHIGDMIALIQLLLKKQVAYEKNGSVYFSIKKDRAYGKMSKLSKKQMFKIANERGNNPNDPNKKDPLDFVLWQKEKPGEPFWPSPWGKGRPGWHIECSAMAMKYLGKTIDIQGGGADLLFPHHESSIAQSESATNHTYARYWMHIGMVKYQGEKMAKSLGNVVLVRDLKECYSANTLRIFLLMHQYRSSWEFFESNMQNAQALSELFRQVWEIESAVKPSLDVARWKKQFYTAMNDDLNTPKALFVLESLAKEVIKTNAKKNVAEAKTFLQKALDILGIIMEYP